MKLRWGITPKLTLVFVLFAAGVLSIVSILVYSSGRKALQNATVSMLLSEAIEKQAALETWVEEKQRDIIVLAANPSLTNHLASHLSASDTAELLAEHNTELGYLEKWTGEGKDFLSLIVLASNSGQVVMSTNPRDLGKFRENQLFFTSGRQGPYVQEIYYSFDQGGVAMVAAAPVNTSDGKLVGVLAGYLNLNKVNEIIQRRTGVNQTDDAYLVNKSNLFVTQPRFVSDPAVLQRGIHSEAVNRCLEHNNGVAYGVDYRNVPAIVVYRWLPNRQLCLIVKMDQAEAYAPVNTLGWNILTISILALALASALAYGLARTITRPVLGMQAAAVRFAVGELNVRLPETSGDELGQIAIAFNKMAGERMRAEEALKRRVAELSALNVMAAIVTESLDVDEILNRSIVEALQLVGVEAAALLLLDEKAGELVMVTHRGLSDEFVQAFSRMKLGEGLSGKAAQTGEPIIMASLTEYPAVRKTYLEQDHIQSAAVIPMTGSAGVIGVMTLGAASPVHFDPAGIELLVALGQQIAIGVEKARLYTETPTNRELSVLYTISRATAQSLNLEETLNNALEATLGVLDVEVGGIYLMEPDGETLTLRVVRGVSEEVARNLLHVKLGEGISGRAVAEQRLVILDVQDYPSERLAPYIVQEGLQSLGSIPLLSGGQAIGAMNLSTRRVRAFLPEEPDLLTAIGVQLGSVVQNARLYEEVQQELAERKRAEKALQQRTAQLGAANKELEAFSYSVSHDLRAPLRGIDGWSQALLEDHYDQLDEQGRQYLDRVRSEVQRMGQLIDDLLQLSQVTHAEMQTSAVDLSALAQTVVARLQAAQPERQVEVIIQPGLTDHGDAALLEIVLTNLLDNAWKFTSTRRQARIEFGCLPHPSLSSSIGRGEGGEGPAYFVKDNGVGFDMAFAQKLFGVFQRMHKTSEFPGSGIGLATVQRIVHRHGGRVWAEACVNTGATFFFTLEEAV